MKKGIVFKLFILTTLLCMFILAAIFIGQTIFFKQYYANQKVNEIETSIQSFMVEYLKAGNDVEKIQKLEQDFYQENMTWIATLDSAGNIHFADDFSLKIQLDPSREKDFSNRTIHIPLYSLIGLEDMERVRYDLNQGNRIYIDGVKKDDRFVPAIVTVENRNSVLENMLLSEKLFGRKEVAEPYPIERSQQLMEEVRELQLPADPGRIIREDYLNLFLKGDILELNLPVGSGSSNIYSNRVFIERVKKFQVDLLFKERQLSVTDTIDFEENNINYKIFIRPLKDTTGETMYIFAMTSLQPVDEAVQMLEDYYIYLIILVLFLVVLASFYYSKKIAKPLLQINDTTSRMANLDFTETIPITSKDEIGTLSNNINTLSNTLHSYIHQLQQDIEKEKRLEKIRKEFISSVSHELKTPLSIMKSCISILEDGVASNKKDYYFKAMAKEVDKMDMLIVDMLELAKFESGTYKMNMDVFYIDEVIEYICEQLHIDIMKKQLHVHKQLSKIKVVANQHRIEQVITNFITNAIRYTPNNERIIISMIEEDEQVKVCVENKGTHIAEDHLEKIWDRFYRGDTSRNRSKGGTGLGLAISKNILELHGSQYGVSNTEDGVLFYFYIKKDE
ncbi:signal transduction histidine kinase [Cytobacillus eiseniae]|uniref:histidine kinase n=1 Tax=Cytobacillus eiseniae TaxID=762947 RepID=A0ABS4RI77_9BACI|nr:HAMP domain-containing sensor histidine kinase [Cytobacillus eiseniae]MBP2242619.1 signal transduction histidine kinase [Cytobacillus eiseniae]